MNDALLMTIPYIVTAMAAGTLGRLAYIELKRIFTGSDSVKLSSRVANATVIIDAGGDIAAFKKFYASTLKLKSKKVDIVVVRRNKAMPINQLRSVVKTSKITTRIYSPRSTMNDAAVIRSAYLRSQKAPSLIVSGNLNIEISKVIKLANTMALDDPALLAITMRGKTTGFESVVDSLQQSFKRLITTRKVQKLPELDFSGTYAGNAGAFINKSTDSELSYKSTVLNGTHNSRAHLTNNIYSWAVFVASVAVLYFLVSTAIAGTGIEAFTFTWASMALIGCIVISFNSKLPWSKRTAVFACVGFLPLLLTLSIIFKNKES